MKCVFLSDGVVSFPSDVPPPVPAKDEALIKVHRSGICGTDIEMACGYKDDFRGCLGHEFVGTVVGLGEDSDPSSHEWLDKRVVGEINIPCDACATCQQGGVLRRNHCPQRKCLGILNKSGAHAEYLCLPVQNLFKVPAAITDPTAVFVEPLAAACRILEVAILKEGDRVAILGDGKLGLLTAEVLGRYPNVTVTLIGKHPAKMQLVQHLVHTTVASDVADVTDAFDVVVDATGSSEGSTSACKLTRPLGTVILKTTCASSSSFPASLLVVKELNVIGSRCGPFQAAIDFLLKHKLSMDKYINAEIPAVRMSAAWEQAQIPGSLKVQIVFDATESTEPKVDSGVLA
eukprot:GILJ01004711.1.p1 GENE.GILJ01004711.1~~GILJ01004711.1.p1  ORF type:complete len:346 (+),score=50.23 GILJ01004711.1:30-1067(+)